jgi:NADH-quinone oxidoreductase subunit M
MTAFSELAWQHSSNWPLLGLLHLLPLLGAGLVFACQERSTAVWLGKAFALVELLLAAWALSRLQPTLAALQLAERIDSIGYHVALDGISAVFLLATCLLVFLMMLYGMSRGMLSPGRLFAVLLLAELALVGMLLTQNIAWFALW